VSWAFSLRAHLFVLTVEDRTIYRDCLGPHDLSCILFVSRTLSRTTRFIVPVEDHTIDRASQGPHDLSWKLLNLK
jgi:hypothetical protein